MPFTPRHEVSHRVFVAGAYWCERFVGGPSSPLGRASGTYEVDGFVLRLVRKSGTREAFSFVYDPAQRPNTMWIDRNRLTRDNGASTTEPLDC